MRATTLLPQLVDVGQAREARVHVNTDRVLTGTVFLSGNVAGSHESDDCQKTKLELQKYLQRRKDEVEK